MDDGAFTDATRVVSELGDALSRFAAWPKGGDDGVLAPICSGFDEDCEITSDGTRFVEDFGGTGIRTEPGAADFCVILLTRDLIVGEEGDCDVEPSSVTFALPSILKVHFSDCAQGETGALQEPGVPGSRRREGDNDGFSSLGDCVGVAGDMSPLLMVGDASPFTDCPVLRRARPMGRGAGFTTEVTEGATGRDPERTGVNNWSLVLPPSNGSITLNMSCRLSNSATLRDMFLSPAHHCTA